MRLVQALAALVGVGIVAAPPPALASDPTWTGRITLSENPIMLAPDAEHVTEIKWTFPDRKGLVDRVVVCASANGGVQTCREFDPDGDHETRRNKRGWSTWITLTIHAEACSLGIRSVEAWAVAYDDDLKRRNDRAWMTAQVSTICM